MQTRSVRHVLHPANLLSHKPGAGTRFTMHAFPAWWVNRGCGKGKLLRLEWKDVDFEKKTL
jgi:hypothetical protein